MNLVLKANQQKNTWHNFYRYYLKLFLFPVALRMAMLNIQYQSDSKIVSMIARGQVKGWECLYDKYSSSMYGIIYMLSKDKNITEDIFVNLFLHLKENMEILITQNERLCTFLMQETLAFARNELKRKSLDADTNSLSETPKLIQLLCAKYCFPEGEAINGDNKKALA